MDIFFTLFEVITPWHWMGLALILIGFEMMLGTYDLLWLSGAAFLTALIAFFLPVHSWQLELVIFAASGTLLVILGRTKFAGLKNVTTDRPNLNQRGKSLVGKRAVTVTAFAAGEGRVKLGDTTWSAISENGEAIEDATEVTVTNVEGTVLTVAPA
ncbi:MAG: hypothetical protein CMK07_09985 [Ponticaulis sp.]|nr:hypothetical protein [Ponticaulis sp.]